MTFDSRWKNPQAKDLEALWRWAQDLTTELRKGSYLPDTAADIAYNNATSGLAADDVQAAIDEVEARVDTLEANGQTLLASGTLPAAGVAITSIPQTFSHLLVLVDGASLDTAATWLLVQPSSDNGSSYDTTAGNYVGLLNTTLVSIAALYVTSAITLAADTFKAQAAVFGYRAGTFKNIIGTANINSGAGATIYNGIYTVTSAINAIRIVPSGTAQFDAGTYALYGVR